MVVYLLRFISQFSEDIIDNHGVITTVTARLKVEQQSLLQKTTRSTIAGGKMEEAWAKLVLLSVSVPPKVRNQPPSDIFNNKTKLQTYSIQNARSDYRNYLKDKRR